MMMMMTGCRNAVENCCLNTATLLSRLSPRLHGCSARWGLLNAVNLLKEVAWTSLRRLLRHTHLRPLQQMSQHDPARVRAGRLGGWWRGDRYMSMSVRTVRIILIFETYSLRIREKVLTLNHIKIFSHFFLSSLSYLPLRRIKVNDKTIQNATSHIEENISDNFFFTKHWFSFFTHMEVVPDTCTELRNRNRWTCRLPEELLQGRIC